MLLKPTYFPIKIWTIDNDVTIYLILKLSCSSIYISDPSKMAVADFIFVNGSASHAKRTQHLAFT